MSNRKLDNEQLDKVYGGVEITNNSTLEEKQERVEELRGILALLYERQQNAKSYQESMEILDNITKVLREINGLEEEISKNQ